MVVNGCHLRFRLFLGLIASGAAAWYSRSINLGSSTLTFINCNIMFVFFSLVTKILQFTLFSTEFFS